MGLRKNTDGRRDQLVLLAQLIGAGDPSFALSALALLGTTPPPAPEQKMPGTDPLAERVKAELRQAQEPLCRCSTCVNGEDETQADYWKQRWPKWHWF
jgi:hypothetical protein